MRGAVPLARALPFDPTTPSLKLGRVVAEGKRILTRVEAATGKVQWSIELPGRKKYEASPTGADGKLYLRSQTHLYCIGEK